MTGPEIRTIRKSLRLTQAEFAKLLSMSPRWVWEIEQGGDVHPMVELFVKTLAERERRKI